MLCEALNTSFVRRIGCAILAALMWADAAASCRPVEIRFSPGSSSATLRGGIPRGEPECFVFRARAGQLLSLNVQSTEDNVVMQLFRPGWRIAAGEQAADIAGSAVHGLQPGSDTKRWSGRAPDSGRYLLVLGTTRGGGDYALHIAVAGTAHP
jgi:hypothetical protein